MKKLENFWFYYKKPLLIGLIVLVVLGYLGVQKASSPKPDYHIALVQSEPCSEEYLAQLEARFTAAGADCNGDGQVLVKIHTYFVDLKAGTDNTGSAQNNPVAALDADLIGNVSGIFLLEDVETFQEITGNLLEGVVSDFDPGLCFALRKDADSAYKALVHSLF